VDCLIHRYFLIVLVRIYRGAVLDTGRATCALVFTNVPWLLRQGHVEVSNLTFYALNFRIGENLYVWVPADLDQFGCENSHGAVVGRKGLIQLRHVAADARPLFNQIDLEPGRGKIERGLNAADTATDNHYVSVIGVLESLARLFSNEFFFHFLSPHRLEWSTAESRRSRQFQPCRCFAYRPYSSNQWRFAVIALHYATKDLVAALGAHVAGFLVLNPLFSAEFPSVRHGSKDDPLAYGHRKIVNVTTGKITALVTARVSLFLRAGSDVTLAAVHESVVRQAALAMNVIHGEVFAMRQRAFAGRASPVEVYEPLLELGVIVTFCNVNRTHTAIETTRRDEIRICGHSFPHSRSVGLAK
jgi:hypothetical protein